MKVINAEQFTFVCEPVLSDQILPKWTLLQNSLRKKEPFGNPACQTDVLNIAEVLKLTFFLCSTATKLVNFDTTENSLLMEII